MSRRHLNLFPSHDRALGTESFSDVDIKENFKEIHECWAAIKTTTGTQSFNDVGTNLSGAGSKITHNFYIRYINDSTITSQDFVLYDSNRYKIDSIEDLDMQKKFFLIRATFMGQEDIEANKA